MNRFLAAIEDAFEWNRDFNLDVVAAPRPRLSAENAIEDSGPAKIKAKSAENVLEVDAAEQVFG
jgi:hypothetical protein